MDTMYLWTFVYSITKLAPELEHEHESFTPHQVSRYIGREIF